MANSIFSINRGNASSYIITFVGDIDLMGKTVMFTVKYPYDNSDNDDNALIKKDITTHLTTKTTQLNLSISDTSIACGTYKWDIAIYTTANPIDKKNSSPGSCIVTDIVTKR
jgi:hypothetical protein